MLFEKSEDHWREMMKPWLAEADSGRLAGFGFSELFRRHRFLQTEKGLRFQVFYDNNPRLHEQIIDGLQICSPLKIAEDARRIVIFTGAPGPIRRQLTAMGLKEYENFIGAEEFFALYHWLRSERIVIQGLAQALTLKCSLRCLDCTMLITRQKKPEIFSLEELKNDIDLLMNFADGLQNLGLVGGEPLLNPALPDYINYLRSRYPGRVENLSLTTNGTIKPSPELLQTCRDQDVFVNVSDYSSAGLKNYVDKLSKIMTALAASNCRHRLQPTDSFWFKRYTDFSEKPLVSGPEELRRHYHQCQKQSRCLGLGSAGRLYPCFMSWSADEAAFVSAGPGDFLDLRELNPGRREDRLKFLRTALGACSPNDFPALCSRCYGNDPAMLRQVPPARQLSTAR